MGMLRVAGAIGGAGQGMAVIGAEIQKERMMHLETQREMALMGLKAEYEREQQGRQFNFEGQQQGRELSARHQDVATETGSAMRRTQYEVGARREEGAANRTAAQRRTDTIVAGREKVAAERNSKTQKPRWSFKTLPGVTADPFNHVPGRPATQLLNDEATGNSYVQVGDKFVRYNAGQSAPTGQNFRRASNEDIQNLVKNPQDAPAFESAYGYLPQQFISAQRNSMVSSSAQSSQAPEGSDEAADAADENAVGPTGNEGADTGGDSDENQGD